MADHILDGLIGDADLIAEVGVRLGRIKDVGFLAALTGARAERDAGTADPGTVVNLQHAINAAAADLAPITLYHLRAGWRPYETGRKVDRGTILFGLFSLLLLLFAAYTTQVYNRATLLYQDTLTLQETRGSEAAIRLFGLLRKNQKDVIESLTSGNKDFLYEAFNKSLSDLEMMKVRYAAYAPMAVEVLSELDYPTRLGDLATAPFRWFSPAAASTAENPTDDPRIADYIRNYAQTQKPSAPTPAPVDAPVKPNGPVDLKTLDLPSLLGLYLNDVRSFNQLIQVGFDPLAPMDYSFFLFRFRESLSLFGFWILPGLYGMLGAVIFQMRRILDPLLPNSTWIQFACRIVLGGFAGIILVWFWSPNVPKDATPVFATLSSFGFAFLVGFSTDVFFQALDRFVTNMSQTIGKVGA